MLYEEEDILTTAELAHLLYLNEHALIRLAEEGNLPASRIANQFQFSREKIWEWLDVQMNQNKYSEALFEDLEKGEFGRAVPVSKFLKPKHIFLNMKATTKDEALIELTENGNETGLVKKPQELLASLRMREELASTALDQEIAFPHPRQANWEIMRNTLVSIGVSQKGIEFGSMDGLPVKVFVMLAIPMLPLHLQILSRLARIFRDGNIKKQILEASTPDEVVKIIQEKENLLSKLSNGEHS